MTSARMLWVLSVVFRYCLMHLNFTAGAGMCVVDSVVCGVRCRHQCSALYTSLWEMSYAEYRAFLPLTDAR